MPRPVRRKGDSKNPKAKESVSEDSWKSEIENLSLNDGGWKCAIAMIVETRPDHARYLDLFTEAADQETRDSVFSLSYEKLIRGIKLSSKSDPRQGICHFANKKIEADGEGGLGPWLTCRLIKYFVNRAKTRNLEILQSRARIEKGIAKEIETLGKNAGPNTPAESRGGLGEKITKSFDKVNTRLRKRGEEWRDRIHVDDAPLQGPNLYVILSGFRDINLSDEMLKAGLPLTAIFKVLRPGEEPDLDHPQLRTFWSSLDATLKDPRTAARYSEVVFQTFCPPEIRESELEALKTDAYRRISFLMYDLCDIKRQHDGYIGKMKLQSGLEQRKPEVLDTGTYDKIMRIFPEECASVAIVLDALLSQIEDLKIPEGAFDRGEKSPEDLGERLQSKIDYLNNRFDIFDDDRAEIRQGDLNPRLILHGDDFGRKTRFFGSGEFGIRVLEKSGNFAIWKNLPVLTSERMEMHRCHIRRISNCFDAEIDDSKTEHYLHILLFDKLINGKYRRSNLRERDDLERKMSFPRPGELRLKANVKRTKSQAIISDRSIIPETFSFPSSLIKSDSAIEYGKEIAETFECPELFGLIDTREMLRPGFIETQESRPVENPEILDLEEFDTVQLLPAKVFSQVFFACSQKFDAFETRYFPPTDSVLILFRNDHLQGDKILEAKYAASIRTPVCLRDFAGFVMEEEREWLEKEDEEDRARRKRLAEESAALSFAQTRKDGDDLPLASFYTDADFLLPNSIKGSEIRKEKSRQGLIGGTEAPALYTRAEFNAKAKNEGAKEPGETNPKAKAAKTQKKKGKVINPGHKREESLGTSISFSPLKPILSSEETGPHFLGYAIASHRVQVSGSTSDFMSIDGTVVKVDLEEWCYGKGRLQITVKLLGNDLVLHNVAGDDFATFHFATTNGILMGFSSALKREEKRASRGSGRSITKGNYHGGKMGRESETPKGTWTPEMAVDPGFRASWPSGLVVETLPGDGPSEPFYIKQSYLSKGPECTGIQGERLRVFLRDGTILVFLEDRTVRVMRSNGCIVNCVLAKDDEEQEEEEEEDSLPASRLKTTQNSKGSVEVKTRLKSLSNSAKDDGVLGLENATRNSKHSKIHRSVVLDPDGRLYEIYDGEKDVRVLGQELVRTASDYEVGEKFTRRNDGTNILINTDGFLAVCFPDETRITTGYVIKDDPVFCEWTEEELERFSPASNGDFETGENVFKEEDGFVSIFLTSCMEHKNYATVSYDQSKIECTLSMPGNVGVQISSDSFFSVDIGGLTSLEVTRSEITFTGKMGLISGRGSSSSVFSLGDFSSSLKPKKPFLETTDSLGNIFSVDSEGKTAYKKFERRCNAAEDDEEPFSSPTVENNRFQSDPKSYRLFAVNRDLSAHEYLHYSERQNQEADQTASIFFHQVGEQPNSQILCTTMTALNPITVSEKWLQSYKVKSIRPRNEDRRDLLRSTYSIPWNYLIPYGKNGRGIRERTWNLALKNRGDFSDPEVLLGRTTERIKNRDENVLKKLQGALGCYWQKSINNFGEYEGLVTRRSGHPEKREIQDWLNDFALGRKATFDKALYFDGLFKRRDTQRLESRISKIRTSGSKDMANKGEIEWYKTCLRDHTVPPYFDYDHGVCFTWVLECVNKVGETGKKETEKKNERTNE